MKLIIDSEVRDLVVKLIANAPNLGSPFSQVHAFIANLNALPEIAKVEKKKEKVKK